MFQDTQSNIRNINIVEKAGGAVVEMTLADAPELDDAEEYLVLSLHVKYGREHPRLEEIKKEVLSRARSVLTNETKRIQDTE